MSTEELLMKFSNLGWPDNAWAIDVREDKDRRFGIKFVAHKHGPWNQRTKVYGVEQTFDTFAEAAEWLAGELL